MTNEREFRAIDPMALLLSNAVYAKLKLPNPNPEDIKGAARQIVQRLEPGERRATLESLRAFTALATALEGELDRVEVDRPQVRARS